MNQRDFDRYYSPAMSNILGLEDPMGTNYYLFKDKFDYFDKQLGIDLAKEYFARPTKYDFPLSDELRNLLINLAGPHGKTILKIYRIQKGLGK